MKVVLDNDMPLPARVYCECGRRISFRPDMALTVEQVFQAAEHALFGCHCQVEKRRQKVAELDAEITELRSRLSAP